MKICTSAKKKKWAFDSVITEIAAALPEVNFIEDRNAADIFLQMAPSFYFGNFAELQRTVCRLSGSRWANKAETEYDKIIKNLTECHTLIATNSALEKMGLEINKATVMIPNGLNLKAWEHCQPQERGSICVGFAGNICNAEKRRHKGFDIVKEVCSSLSGVTLKVALYGEGQIPHANMLSHFYRAIDVLVLPTDNEGCSNVITEALACGVPVITTREAGYHGERMKHRHNIVFCEKSTDSVSHCLRMMIDDIDFRQRLSTEGRKFVEQNQDIRIIAKAYLDTFNSCWYSAGGDVPRSETADKEIIQKLDIIISLLSKKSKRKVKA